MTALSRKLLRDLVRLAGQVVTIALVVASGIASFVALRGSYTSLQQARAAFYDRQRFGDVFASLERAPDAVRAELEAIPGVQRAQTRVVAAAMVPLEGVAEPIRARVVSLPPPEGEILNALHLFEGRRPEPGHADEAVLLHAFAEARGIRPGDRVAAVINGKRREIVIVGTAASPEYVLAMPAGSMTSDPDRFAVLWMSPEALAAAFRMEGAFNDVSLALAPGASEAGVIDGLDRALAPYGGLGAYGRAHQPSNHVLEGELLQLRSMSTVLPAIFLGVAALLVHVVLSRLVHLEQPEIATLKALGYSDARIGLHFLELVLVVGCLGAALGVGLGSWLGAAMVGLYERFFRFPELAFRLEPWTALFAAGSSLAAATAGALGAVRRAAGLPPAEAMRPPAPARYRRSLVDRLGLARAVGPSMHMIVRELERRPLRTLLSSLAIAASTALCVVGGWYYDGVEALVHTQFHEVMREDIAVTLIEPRPERALRELAHLPGVTAAEGLRVVPVRLRAGHRHRDTAIWGYPDAAEMRSLRDKLGRQVPLPPDGVVLTGVLAEVLGVAVGDSLDVELHEGERAARSLVVTGLVDEAFGMQGHMRIDALRAWLGEQPLVSVALLRIDPAIGDEIDARLKEMPFIADVTRRAGLLARFRDQSASMILTAAAIISLLAATITVGVVYNNARIALSTRGRDLASLRVLGFTRGEVSAVLLGELAVQVLVALPLGLWLGRGLVGALASTVDPETYRLPVILTPKSYAFAAVVTLAAATLSALLVRRRVDALDLIAVLKTRE